MDALARLAVHDNGDAVGVAERTVVVPFEDQGVGGEHGALAQRHGSQQTAADAADAAAGRRRVELAQLERPHALVVLAEERLVAEVATDVSRERGGQEALGLDRRERQSLHDDAGREQQGRHEDGNRGIAPSPRRRGTRRGRRRRGW